MESLPPGPVIVVANHASWLDGPILVAALPPRFNVVAKSELRRNPLLRMALERIGTAFVERTEAEHSVADAGRLAESLQAGRPLVFFPEGTIRRAPGLHTFHTGAFVTAAQTGVPLVPMAIMGTRSVLRAGQWFPRKAEVRIQALPTQVPAAPGWDEALALRSRCRSLIARALGEPMVD